MPEQDKVTSESLSIDAGRRVAPDTERVLEGVPSKVGYNKTRAAEFSRMGGKQCSHSCINLIKNLLGSADVHLDLHGDTLPLHGHNKSMDMACARAGNEDMPCLWALTIPAAGCTGITWSIR